MTQKRQVFEDSAADYDRWFDDHAGVYRAQLRLLGRAVPHHGSGLEVGVGSGRFAAPLGIRCGIDPSVSLAVMARGRDIEVVVGCGEHLPYRSGTFDYALLMTVICFIDRIGEVFREVYRVLDPSGIIVLGFLEQGGEIYQHYHAEPEKGRFLRHARFFTTDNVIRELRNAGFSAVEVTMQSHGFCVLTGRRGDSCTPQIPL